MDGVRERAYAKINLGLKVLGRRPDGYHNILSVFQTVDLSDSLRFEPSTVGSTQIVCDHSGVPTGPENLVHRAIEVLRSATGIRKGVRVILKKRIPMGAGLGGGSSDAAAALRALNRAWGLALSPEALRELAGRLGSDVFFFLSPGTAVVSGRGEQVRYISWPEDAFYVLVNPGFEVSTRWAYDNLRIGLTERSAYISFMGSIEGKEISASRLFDCLENDFMPLLAATYPEVGRIGAVLDRFGPVACSVSGSGSTLFGVFREIDRAREAETGLRDLGYWVALCRPVPDDQGTASQGQEDLDKRGL